MVRIRVRTLARAMGGLAAIGLATLSFVAPASAGGGGGGSCSGFERGATISIADFCYQGVAHFVAANAAITVRNDGETTHDIRAVDGSFSSPLLEPGDTYRFDAPPSGLVRYYCSLHGTAQGQGMSGVLVVGDGAASQVDVVAASAPSGNDTTDAVAAAQYSEPGDTALIVGSVALVVGVLALAGLIGTSLARFMRPERPCTETSDGV